MKREAMGHTKMRRLCLYLDIPLWQAVGLLESLWHLTSREAPTGAIGRLVDEDIALGLDYRGDIDRLLAALVKAQWLDIHPTLRLVVHDWAEHADDLTNATLLRRGLRFWDEVEPRRNQHLRICGSTRKERRRERMAAAGYVGRKLRSEVLSRDKFSCVGCQAHADLTIDHVVPVALGGTSDKANLQTLCRRCNSRKGARLMEAITWQ